MRAQAEAEAIATRHGIKDHDLMERLIIPLCGIDEHYFEADERGVLTHDAHVRQETAAARVEEKWGDLKAALQRHRMILEGRVI